MPPVGFEPTISSGDWPQTYALDRAATRTGMANGLQSQNLTSSLSSSYCMNVCIKVGMRVMGARIAQSV